MRLPEILNESKQVTVTRHGYPVATILSNKDYEQICEDLERMSQELQSFNCSGCGTAPKRGSLRYL